MGCQALKFRVVYRFNDKYPISDLCDLLNVSRSGYYKWLKIKDSSDKDVPIADLIRQCHQKKYKTYGYRRVKIWLKDEAGLMINHKAVLRIMRKYDILAYRRRKKFSKYDSITYHTYENVLAQNFNAERPNQKWVTDISYIYTKEGFFYLSVIKDLYDNSIVSYRYANKQSNFLATATVTDALNKERVTGKLILHSDQGFQYTSTIYRNILVSNDIQPSMSRRGNPYEGLPPRV